MQDEMRGLWTYRPLTTERRINPSDSVVALVEVVIPMRNLFQHPVPSPCDEMK